MKTLPPPHGAPLPVVRGDKNLAGAFAMAFLGLVLGVFGMHRYYLKQRIYGTLLSSVFLSGLLVIFLSYAGMVNEVLTGYLSYSASGNIGHIPDIGMLMVSPPLRVYLGVGLCVVGIVWFFVDLLYLPSAVKKYRAGK